MKYIKTYEGVWLKKLKEGNIYLIDEMLIAEKGYKHNFRLGKIIKLLKLGEAIIQINMKTYIKGTTEEYIFYDFKNKFIKRLATPEEINEFEAIENSKKYNI